MKRRIALCLLALCMQAACALAGEYGRAYVDGITADRIHLRAQPSKDAPSLGLYFTGAPVVLDAPAENGWQAVTAGGQRGYMMQAYLRPEEEAEGLIPCVRSGEVWDEADGAGRTALYAAPRDDAQALGQLQGLQAVLVYGQTKDGWYDVGLGDGLRGYIREDELTLGQPVAVGDSRFSTVRSMTAADGQTLEVTLEDTGIHFGRQDEGELCEIRIRRGDAVQRFGYLCETVPDDAPRLAFDDVNMDGHMDVVALRTMGASDAYAVYFLYRPETGVFARCMEMNGFSAWRYALYPQERIIVNHLRESAGAARYERYQWQGDALVLLDSGVKADE